METPHTHLKSHDPFLQTTGPAGEEDVEVIGKEQVLQSMVMHLPCNRSGAVAFFLRSLVFLGLEQGHHVDMHICQFKHIQDPHPHQ